MIEFLTLNDAVNLIGIEEYTKQIKWMCKVMFEEVWWNSYFKYNLDVYPSYISLFDITMKLTNDKNNDGLTDKSLEGHIQGIVAVLDKTKIIGYINILYNESDIPNIQIDEDTIWISDLFIWPEFRNKGIAKKLFIEIINWINKTKTIQNKPDYLYLCCESHLVDFYKKQNCIQITYEPDETGWVYLKIKR